VFAGPIQGKRNPKRPIHGKELLRNFREAEGVAQGAPQHNPIKGGRLAL